MKEFLEQLHRLYFSCLLKKDISFFTRSQQCVLDKKTTILRQKDFMGWGERM
jgi:hypothetical protein